MSPGALHRVLRAIFVFGAVGTAAELLLLEHVEDAWQLAPLALLGVACVALALVALRPSAVSVALFRFTMMCFIVSGAIGIALHYQGNVEFELELQPDLTGFRLAWEALRGATPALAPGTMMLLGALGLTCTAAMPGRIRSSGA